MQRPASPFLARAQATETSPRTGEPARTSPRVNRPRSLTHPPRRLTLFSSRLTLSASSLTLLPRKLTLFGKTRRSVCHVSTPPSRPGVSDA